MDPNANLFGQLKVAATDWTGKDTAELTPAELNRLHRQHILLCELVQALDQWIAKGGFLPERWALRQGRGE